MDKINILIVPIDFTAVGNYRFIEPHLEIQKQFPDEFYVDINPSPDWDDKKYLDRFQIIIGSHLMFPKEEMESRMAGFKSAGQCVIVDFDDYWNLNKEHMLYASYIERNNEETATKMMRLVDAVTTTTPALRDEIAKYNKQVTILPNAIDPTANRVVVQPTESERIRIGYMGGSTHLRDLELVRGMFSTITSKYPDRIQNVLCGFDMGAAITDMDSYGRFFKRKMRPDESIWVKYEEIFTDNYKGLSKEYLNYLKKYKPDATSLDTNSHYKRIWSKPFSSYLSNYNQLDIAIAPLENNRFTSFKSQLKVIESGFYKKAIICSDSKPFQNDILDGKNGILVKNTSSKGWTYQIKRLIENPSLIKEYGESLYEHVKDKYDLRNVTKDRAEFYRSLIK